ncbi:MAG: hypothetical protein ABSB18_01830 [Candidatus Omnitrophota bacterium]
MKFNSPIKLVLLILLFICIINSIVFGAILEDWKDSNAYKPAPILFLHGFGPGNPNDWNYIKSQLNQYLTKYNGTLGFLETINFNDPNGSIDTYGDSRAGWADKVKDKVDNLLDIYKFKGSSLKVELVCHSMGGLAAREYSTNPKYGNGYLNIDKIITIGTPHCGTPLANIKEKTVCDLNKVIWELPGVDHADFYIKLEANNTLVQLLKNTAGINPNGEAVKDMAIGSQFLANLNDPTRSSSTKNYVLFGKINDFLNWFFFRYYYPNDSINSGDTIVPIDSQKGYDIFTNYSDPTKYRWVWNVDKTETIPKSHLDELNSEDTVNKLLSFLDSTPPQLEITSPAQWSEINETSFKLQGKVYKEYLPADTQLIINIIRTDDNTILPTQTYLLKPSDLWIPNNQDSPVAEFDETINLPGKGIYAISCQLKNPAGQISDTQVIFVQVNAQLDASIIVHCHNPEGKEINSITGIDINSAVIYDGDTLIGYGAHDSATHGTPIRLTSGMHHIKAIFNNMELSQDINLTKDQTQTLTFTFERIEEYNSILNALDAMPSWEEDFDLSGFGYGNEYMLTQGTYRIFVRVGSGEFKGHISVRLNRNIFSVECSNLIYMYAGGIGNSCGVFFSQSDLSWYPVLFVNPIPLSIPFQTFHSWYIQGYENHITNLFLVIQNRWGDRPFDLPLFSQSNSLGYFCGTIPAENLSFVGLKLFAVTPTLPIFQDVEIGGAVYTGNPDWTGTVTYNPVNADLSTLFFRFSSVPYDLDGHAI